MDDSLILEMRSYLDGSANGRGHCQFEELILNGLKIIHLEKGILRCKFVITERVSRQNGVWDTGAIVGMMDVMSFATMYSLSAKVHVTLSLNSSFYSTAKIHESVEIEGKLTGSKGKIKAVMVEIRKEGSREVIARGSLWMASLELGLKDLPPSISKSNLK